MDYSNEAFQNEDLDDMATKLRGNVIHLMVHIEALTEEVLMTHFCGNNISTKEDFLYSILSKEQFGLKFKYDVLAYIIKNNFKEFESENPDFLTSFGHLIDIRNVLAHRKFLSGSNLHNFKEKKIYFQNYKTSKNKKQINNFEFSTEKVMKVSKDCMIIHSLLLEFLESLKENAKGNK